MADEAELIEWAKQEVARLKGIVGRTDQYKLATGEAAPAVEFLRRHAGPQSAFFKQASNGGPRARYAMEVAAQCLEGWTNYVQAGMAEMPFAIRSRVEAATDLMEQVQVLLDDAKVHPAAPVMLAGAALEEWLRGQVVTNAVAVKGKPGLSSYASALRAVDLLTAQDVKDVTAVAGIRNDAAHGAFEKVNRDRAALLADQVNLFLRQKTGG